VTVAAIALRSAPARAAAALAAALCLAGIGVSESRGALIAFAAGMLYLMVRSSHRWRLIPQPVRFSSQYMSRRRTCGGARARGGAVAIAARPEAIDGG
jgi:hypothetical protein